MKEEVELILATVDDAELIHQMQYKAFLPLYEKYHDDETTPVNEKIDNMVELNIDKMYCTYLRCSYCRSTKTEESETSMLSMKI